MQIRIIRTIPFRIEVEIRLAAFSPTIEAVMQKRVGPSRFDVGVGSKIPLAVKQSGLCNDSLLIILSWRQVPEHSHSRHRTGGGPDFLPNGSNLGWTPRILHTPFF